MEPNPHVAQKAAALLEKLSANRADAISGGGADTAPPPPIDISVPMIGPNDPAFAAAVVNVYENIVEATSALIERVLGPNDSQP